MVGLLTDTGRAFSQLTADRQFAHLGVFLLGVLGEVDAAVGLFVGAEGKQRERETASADDGGGAVPVGEEMDVAAKEEEMGVAVVRGEMGVAVVREEMGVAVARGGTIIEEEREEKVNVVKKKKKARGDEFDDIFGALEGKLLAKRLKREKARGDGVDDVFGVLAGTAPAKRAKKKRKVNGDEFDDIFGGL